VFCLIQLRFYLCHERFLLLQQQFPGNRLNCLLQALAVLVDCSERIAAFGTRVGDYWNILHTGRPSILTDDETTGQGRCCRAEISQSVGVRHFLNARAQFSKKERVSSLKFGKKRENLPRPIASSRLAMRPKIALLALLSFAVAHTHPRERCGPDATHLCSEEDWKAAATAEGPGEAGRAALQAAGSQAEVAAALVLLEESLDLDSQTGFAGLFALEAGLALQRLGRLDEARSTLRASVELDGTSFFGHYNLANLERERAVAGISRGVESSARSLADADRAYARASQLAPSADAELYARANHADLLTRASQATPEARSMLRPSRRSDDLAAEAYVLLQRVLALAAAGRGRPPPAELLHLGMRKQQQQPQPQPQQEQPQQVIVGPPGLTTSLEPPPALVTTPPPPTQGVSDEAFDDVMKNAVNVYSRLLQQRGERADLIKALHEWAVAQGLWQTPLQRPSSGMRRRRGAADYFLSGGSTAVLRRGADVAATPPWWDAHRTNGSRLPLLREIGARWREVQAECDAVMRGGRDSLGERPVGVRVPEDAHLYNRSSSDWWTEFPLHHDWRPWPGAEVLAPRTMRMLDGYAGPYAVFSILHPRTRMYDRPRARWQAASLTPPALSCARSPTISSTPQALLPIPAPAHYSDGTAHSERVIHRA
jgi:tetratricopeptide (TPR) repeat protein